MGKKQIGDNIVFNNIDNRVVVEISPEVTPQKQNLSKDNFRLAELLTLLRSFNKSILKVRQEINLNKLLPYPKKPSVINVVKIFSNKRIDNKAKEILEKWAKELRKKYRLPENWDIPFEIAALTNILPVPPTEAIGIHLPKGFYLNEREIIVGFNKGIIRKGTVLEYPAIYFTSSVSIDKLKRWINENKSLIRAVQDKLPKEKKLRRKRKTLFWGQVAWIYRKSGMTWARISRKIEKWMESMQEIDYNENKDIIGDAPPGPEELKKYYTRFVDSLRRLETP